MAVEIRYHVIRDGKEVAMYASKKEADEHDKMLDIAESLSEFIENAGNIKLDDDILEELSIYISKNREEVVRILRGGRFKKEEDISDSSENLTDEEKEVSLPKRRKPSSKLPLTKEE